MTPIRVRITLLGILQPTCQAAWSSKHCFAYLISPQEERHQPLGFRTVSAAEPLHELEELDLLSLRPERALKTASATSPARTTSTASSTSTTTGFGQRALGFTRPSHLRLTGALGLLASCVVLGSWLELRGFRAGWGIAIFGLGAHKPNVRPFLFRIGIWGVLHYTILIIRNPKNSIGNFLGHYHGACGIRLLRHTFGVQAQELACRKEATKLSTVTLSDNVCSFFVHGLGFRV